MTATGASSGAVREPWWKATREAKSSDVAASTSDLSIDEELVLHSVGWEPVALVYGTSIYSVPSGVWNWGSGEIASASAANAKAFRSAIARLHDECARAGAHGVVGVEVEVAVSPHHVSVQLTGSAIRPMGASAVAQDQVFVSDLSGRDFSLLTNAGWAPLGLVAGSSYVFAPRRGAGAAFQQANQNIELTNFTEAIYAARESAMERMQAQALTLAGDGVVGVRVTEGPLPFARHAVGFAVYGTAVHLVAEAHRATLPEVAVSLDDSVVSFDAANTV